MDTPLVALTKQLHLNGIDAVLKRHDLVEIIQNHDDIRLRIVYHITWWPSDPSVPLLTFNVFENEVIITSVEKLYELVVPEEYQGALREGMMGGLRGSLTQGEHPVYGYPVFFIHPCQTREFLETVGSAKLDYDCGDDNHDTKRYDYEKMEKSHLLYMWLQTYGQVVGLKIPLLQS